MLTRNVRTGSSSKTSLCRRLRRLNYLFLRFLAPAHSLFALWQESLRDHSVTANSTSVISRSHLRCAAVAQPRGGGRWLPCSQSCLARFPRSGEAPHAPRTPRPLWQDATKSSSVTSAGSCHFFGSRYSSAAPPPPMLVFSPRKLLHGRSPSAVLLCRCRRRYKISR